jgi:cobalt-precorrin 5A hydrolase
MDLDQTVMVAGIGCRAGVTAEQVEAALAAALQQNALHGLRLTLIATPAVKSGEPALLAVARARGIPLTSISQAELEAASPRTLTRSERSMAAMHVHSVAEAAALASCGSRSQLLGPRVVVGPVTCALAVNSSAEN